MGSEIFRFTPLFLLSEFASGRKQGNEKQNCGISLKYPVVLAHGIAKNDNGGKAHSWGRIPQILSGYGVNVYFGNTDAWGSVESNSRLLKMAVDKVLKETGSEKVNLITHSKGGIDSRYFIWKYQYGDRVASLTTISTPHRGSEIADIICCHKRTHTKRAQKRLAAIGKLFGDENPDVYNSILDLTTAKMNEFNQAVKADNRVYYQSVYSLINSPLDDPFFLRSYNYIKIMNGDNDGMVSEYSARWGDNIIKIDDCLSHDQIIDWRVKTSMQNNIPGIYLKITDDLAGKGF